jgi:dTDP-D-glucose 4,6-dehydratase
MEKVLVVGENSFIAKSLPYDRISYKNFDTVDLAQYHTVINCALDPEYKSKPYSSVKDVDFEIGTKACQKSLRYVMFSTSKVYGNNIDLSTYTEKSNVSPFDYHSNNKLKTESKLISNFGDNVTIFRGSNIFGLEYGRNSFIGYMMTSLLDHGLIKMSIDPSTKKDFLFVEDASKIIQLYCKQKLSGIYNLSSNYGLEAGKIAEYLTSSYGSVAAIDLKPDRGFILDNTKLQDHLGIKIGPFDFENIFKKLGSELCKI